MKPKDGLGVAIIAILILGFIGLVWWDVATCAERGPERPYVVSCGKDCIQTVYRSECVRRKE